MTAVLECSGLVREFGELRAVARSIAHQARSHRVTVATTLSAAGQLGVPFEPGEVSAVVLLRRSLAR